MTQWVAIENQNPLRALWEAVKAPALWAEVMEKKTLADLKRALLESKIERSVCS